ncbi:MAG: GTPase EngA [Candidatus Desulfovibrio kirbyi]|uniref:GTPase Der n=2 Tax=Candidatus Desulfovibrio kirbyi TaxID=2696086 RepID=A0A6L2R5E9_9BACT|nr:MAG: GTPase EngA [Candidatus Desulfovibrio kirbyi]
MSDIFSCIVLAGRPNVGKSTLFNRLIRSNRAITHDMPGITRDRMEGVVRRAGLPPFGVMDTGGLTLNAHAAVTEGPDGVRGFEQDILRQTATALDMACGVALVVDGQNGLLPLDEHLAAYLRRTGLPVLCVVNKVDGMEREDERAAEFHNLGFPLLAVSAEHGYNIALLARYLADMLPKNRHTAPPAPPALRLAVLGRPNAGKSSLVNALVDEDRMIVSEVAGTTRDSVDARFMQDGQDYVFVDTPGVRRRAKITDCVEKYSVNSALKSSSKADITLLVLDAAEGVGQQDKRLMDILDTRKTPFFILLNKCDLAPQKSLAQLRQTVRDMLTFCAHVPVMPVSAMTGRGINKILSLAKKIHEECQVRISTGRLNRAMEEVLTRHQPPVVKQARAKFFYMTQAETAPPTFVFFVSDSERVPENYVRYLERALRKLFALRYAPMRIRLRSSHQKKHGAL